MNRYEKAWRYLWNKLPKWKRDAIEENMKEKTNSSFFDTFVQEVAKLAEGVEKIPVQAECRKMVMVNDIADSDLPDYVPPWHKTNGANGDDYNEN